jgi:hypothetical protein
MLGPRTLSTLAGIALTVSRLRIQGWIMIFPEFQRSHVNTHAASLMLDHAFRLPADGGWGLRRMQWMGACPCACSPLHPDHSHRTLVLSSASYDSTRNTR